MGSRQQYGLHLYLQKEQCDHGQKMKVFGKGNLVLWMPKDEKIKSGKFRMPWE